jgi:hypothetical protein
MPTNIAVITQDEFEPKLLPQANLTMAIPFLDPLFVPKLPKKKFLQMKLWAKQDDAPAPDTHFIQVLSHNRGSSKVPGYKYYPTPSKSQGPQKKYKVIKSKKKTGQFNHPGFPKAKDECKETVQLAYSLHIQELRDLVKGSKK